MAVRDHGLFRKLDSPPPDAAMGGCYVTHDTGPCVDTGVLIEFEGTLCLSVNTIKELAEVAGMSVNEEGIQLEIDNATLQQACENLRAQVADLESQLEAVGLAVARAANIKATK